jgi:hypothetical protein
MRALQEAKCIQIEITNYCNLKCPNCTRFIGHHAKPYFMPIEWVEEALQSLEGYEGIVGCMGGEPTLHPQFKEICYLYQLYLPKERRGLWTNGAKWKEHEEIIRETFPIKNILYNDHDYEYTGQHQPLLIASKDIIRNEELRKELIDKCWVQERWSPSVNPNGAFFCEVAAAMDMLLNLVGGWKIEKGWWNKEPKDFQDQINIYCERCSACIPFDSLVYESELEFASISNISFLDKSYSLYTIPYTRECYEKYVKEWKPGKFRDFYQCEPNKRITKEEYERL